MYIFETDCISSSYELINSMKGQATAISRDDFVTEVDSRFLAQLEKILGYDESLQMKDDWHVSYFESIYNNKSCFYFSHSAIEYIFTELE